MIDFSIVIPSFNKMTFISETIDCVLNQSYANWELIIVDDGSSDDSIQIINTYSLFDKRIKLIVRKNLPKGGSNCRNIGLQEAKGKFILFLDADDILTAVCLEERLQSIMQYEESNFWVFPIGTFYKKKGDSASVWLPKGSDFLNRFLTHDLPWHTMSVIWKREFIEKLKGFDVDYPRLQDVELHTRALLNAGINIKTFPNNKIDAFYRIDEKRTNQNLEELLNRQKLGVFMYLEKVQLILVKDKQRRAIKGTLFSLITAINYNCFVKDSEVDLQENIFNETIEFMENKALFSRKDVLYIKIYNFLYKKGLRSVKGFNFSFKYLFCK
tara:strand:+ start:353 stop:1333 length:981 start_codon:yes stop_codon:yes gene_type:complete